MELDEWFIESMHTEVADGHWARTVSTPPLLWALPLSLSERKAQDLSQMRLRGAYPLLSSAFCPCTQEIPQASQED